MNKKLLIFIVFTCVFSWACWLPIVDRLAASPFESPADVLLLFFLGAYGPTLVAIGLTFFFDKGPGVKALLKNAVSIKRAGAWNLVALLVGPLLYAASLAIYAGLGGNLGAVNYGLLPWIPVVFLVSVVLGPLAEEMGWRGYALPLLDHKRRWITSSIIIGFVWALWHAPLFWAKTGTAISGFPIDAGIVSFFFLAVIGSSFIYTWLFNNTSGSLFTAILLHLSMNATGTITAMLFPEMSAEERFELYTYYVCFLWAVVAVGAVGALARGRKIAAG